MKTCRILWVLVGLSVIITISGCAEALMAGKIATEAAFNTPSKADEKMEIVESWVLPEAYGGFYKIGNRTEIWAFREKNMKFIGKTEYNLNLDNYRTMGADQKKAHVRNYFKERTGIDLDPTETEAPREAVSLPSTTPGVSMPGFAPGKLPR